MATFFTLSVTLSLGRGCAAPDPPAPLLALPMIPAITLAGLGRTGGCWVLPALLLRLSGAPSRGGPVAAGGDGDPPAWLPAADLG